MILSKHLTLVQMTNFISLIQDQEEGNVAAKTLKQKIIRKLAKAMEIISNALKTCQINSKMRQK